MEYENLTLPELKKICKEHKISTTNKKKAELIELLNNYNQNVITNQKNSSKNLDLINIVESKTHQESLDTLTKMEQKDLNERGKDVLKEKKEENIQIPDLKNKKANKIVESKNINEEEEENELKKFYVVNKNEEKNEEGEIKKSKKKWERRPVYEIVYKENEEKLKKISELTEEERIEARKKRFAQNDNKK